MGGRACGLARRVHCRHRRGVLRGSVGRRVCRVLTRAQSRCKCRRVRWTGSAGVLCRPVNSPGLAGRTGGLHSWTRSAHDKALGVRLARFVLDVAGELLNPLIWMRLHASCSVLVHVTVFVEWVPETHLALRIGLARRLAAEFSLEMQRVRDPIVPLATRAVATFDHLRTAGTLVLSSLCVELRCPGRTESGARSI